MALVTCPDCSKQISDQAPTCQHCGRPMKIDGKRVTTQQTAQSIKAQMLLSAVFAAVGIYGLTKDYSTWGIVAATIGVVLYLGARFAQWWHHG